MVPHTQITDTNNTSPHPSHGCRLTRSHFSRPGPADVCSICSPRVCVCSLYLSWRRDSVRMRLFFVIFLVEPVGKVEFVLTSSELWLFGLCRMKLNPPPVSDCDIISCSFMLMKLLGVQIALSLLYLSYWCFSNQRSWAGRWNFGWNCCG